MYFLIHERTEDFYYSLGLTYAWDDSLALMLDLEEITRSSMDETERVIFHFNRIGYSIKEIADYYGTTFSYTQRKLLNIYELIMERELGEKQ